MNPYRLKNVFEYLTSNNQLLKKKLKLGADDIPIPPKRDDVTTIEAINRFNKANPRVDTTSLKPLSVKHSNVRQSNVNEPNEGAIQSAFDTATRDAQFEGYPAPNYEKFKARYLKRNMKADGGRIGFKGGADFATVADSKGNVGAKSVSVSPSGSVTTSRTRGPDGPDDRSNSQQNQNHREAMRNYQRPTESKIKKAIDVGSEASFLRNLYKLDPIGLGLNIGGKMLYNKFIGDQSSLPTEEEEFDSYLAGNNIDIEQIRELPYGYTEPTFMAEGGRAGYEDGGMLVQPSDDGSRPGYAKQVENRQMISYKKYPGVYKRTDGKTSRIKYRIDYMDNEGNQIKFTSPESFENPLDAEKLRNKQIQKLEKELNIPKGKLIDNTFTTRRKNLLLLPKNKKDYITLTEFRNLLGPGAEDMRAMGGSKDTVLAKASAKLLNQTKITTKNGFNYYFYKKPTDKELDLLKKYKDARPIQADMLERIQDLQKDKYTSNILKNGKLPMIGKGKQRVIDPKFLKHVTKNYGTLDKYVHGLVRYSQALDGQNIIGLNDPILSDGKFKSNKKISNQIRNVFLEMPYGSNNALQNTIRKAVYKSAMLDITNELGDTDTTFEQWKDRIRRKISVDFKLTNAGIEIDELIGVSSSMRNKTAPYSVFTQLATEELNQGILKDYQKVLSNYTAQLKNEINKNSKFVDGKWFHSAETKKIVNNFNKNVIPNLKNIDQLKGTNFSLPEMTLGSPTDKTLGGTKGRLATLEKAGLNFKEFYKKEGFGYKMPQGVLTQKELLKELPNLKQDLLKLAGTANKKCKGLLSYGGRVGLEEGLSPEFCINEGKKVARDLVAKNITGSPAQNSIMKRVTSGLTNFVKSALDPKELFDIKKQFFSKGAIASLPFFDAGIAAYEATAMGKPVKEAISDTFVFGSLPRAMGVGMDTSDVLNAKQLLKDPNLSPAGKEYAQLIIDSGNYEQMQSDTTGGMTKKFNDFKEIQDKIKNASTAGRFDYESRLNEVEGVEIAKDDYSPIFGSSGDSLKNKAINKRPNIRIVGPITAKKDFKIDLTPTTYENFKPNYGFTKEQFEDAMRKEGALADDQVYQDAFYKKEVEKPIEFQQLMELPSFRGASEKFASGGIASLTKTIPPESGPTPHGLPYVYNNVKKI